MSGLQQRVDEYLAIRRSLGYKLVDHGSALFEFVGWLDSRGAAVITAELALAWAQSRPTSSPVRMRQRLTMARRFAEYVHAIDPRTEVPAKDLLPAAQQRRAPYIYSAAEILELMAAARRLSPPLRAATYETFIGLLACTGLRFGEAAGLDRSDVDIASGSLLVRFGKYGRSRHVPLHRTTVAALTTYAARRDQLCPEPTSPAFFVTTRGGRLTDSSVWTVFARLRHQTGLDAPDRSHRARIHDLRHTFVVRTMLNWYRNGADVQARLPLLSTYLGHVNPKATYWYQEAAPELLALAARRLEVGSGREP
jgi:integrase/recombinase XerD